ncbi:MAG: hypothetical protein K8R87_12235 [Verrucomicrobia bacterium]|nr:hypothetical protein [Verrucomicrobiota bacterium]
MKTIQSQRCPRSNMGFSLMEVIGVVAVLGLLATIALTSFKSTQGAVVQTKLVSDVTKLNSLVSIYQASGGSLADAVTPQDVLDTLKTVRGVVDATQTVGPVTGRAVDVRLAAKMQTVDEAATSAARVVWNAGAKKFEIAYSGTGGVASFVLDDTLADNDYGAETRADSSVKYNASAGWVWKDDKTQALAFLSPLNAVVTGAAGYTFDPSKPDGGGGNTVIASLPPPSITPRGGSFYLANFITSVTITPGLLVSGSGNPGYKVDHEDGTSTGWLPYTAPFSITYGDTVQARNTTTDAALYSDSATVSESYTVTPTLLTAPLITPAGGSYLASAWPAITIDANGAPVGPYTAISYKVTSAAGVSSAWQTYTGPIVTTYGDTVTAKNVSLNTKFYTDSTTVANTYNVTGSSKLPPPIFTMTTDAAGKQWVAISGDSSKMPIPAGARIYYTLTGADPGNKSTEDPVTGTLYVAGKPIAMPTTAGTYLEITARMYPPTSDKIHFDTSDIGDYDVTVAGPGLAGGHIDVDTAHLIYMAGKGTTDAHVHAYDDKYAVTTVNLMNFLDTKLSEINKIIPNGTRFKLIVFNGNLSPGGKLSINKTYNASDPTTYVKVTDYQNSSIPGLTVYSMDGVSGTVKLTSLTMNFTTDTLAIGGLIGTNTGAVRSNKAGPNGEYRDGALGIQAVKVNADGTDAFTSNVAISNGGNQGAASSGLLWECTMFWHWHGPDY